MVSHSYKIWNYDRQNEQNYREIGQYIKTLVLDFYFTGVESRDKLVAIEDVQLTLKTLLLHTSVEEIEHHGNMYSLWLDQIVKISTLRVLKMRDSPCTVPYTWNDDVLPDTGWHTKLKWDGLCQISSLRVLHVSQLLVSEASDLAHATRLLAGLEELYVGASNTQKEDDTLPLFVTSFLEANNGAFPESSLKRLSLVDIKHSAILDSERFATLKELPNLQYLYFSLPTSGFFTLDFLETVNPDNLTDLTLSISPMSSNNPRWRKLQNLLTRHRTTLRTFTLLNAREISIDNVRDLSATLVSFMHPRQLYLAGSSYTTPWCNEQTKLRQRQLTAQIFGTSSSPLTRGSGIKHLNLDQVNLQDLSINPIDPIKFKLEHLKIIILRPMAKQLYNPLVNRGYRSLPSPPEPFGPDLPDDMSTLRESQIAEEIAHQDLQALRIIVVGRYKYWVQRPKPDRNNRKIWFLRRALEDPEQEAEILQSMDRDDWEFLADKSIGLAEDATIEKIHHANRVVYHNVDFHPT